MTEEEVIKKLKTIKVSGDRDYIYNFEAAIVLNLIQKQQKEIEELQEVTISASAVNKIDTLQKEIEIQKGFRTVLIEDKDNLNKELEKKDKIIDLLLQDMINQKCYSTSKTTLKKIYEKKVEDN